ncbi:hypothetical protein LINGRAHAP2_LOCUS22918, partial [Linum grandiflorum]
TWPCEIFHTRVESTRRVESSGYLKFDFSSLFFFSSSSSFSFLFVFSDSSLSPRLLRRPNLRLTSIKPPQNPPVPFPYNPPPSNLSKTRFSPSFLQKSEFGSFALRVRFLAIFRRFSGWLNISALVCTKTPLSPSSLFRMTWRQLASTSRIS